jgi:hypothetical protein
VTHCSGTLSPCRILATFLLMIAVDFDDDEEELKRLIVVVVAARRLQQISENTFLRQELGHTRVRESWLERSGARFNDAEYHTQFHFTRPEMMELTRRLLLPEVELVNLTIRKCAGRRDDGKR